MGHHKYIFWAVLGVTTSLAAEPKKKVSKKKALDATVIEAANNGRKGQFSLGFGFWNVVLPELGLQGGYQIADSIWVGGFASYFVVPLSQVSAQSQSLGVFGRYRRGDMFYGGAFASRTIYLSSKSGVGVNGATTSVSWLSRTQQLVLTPEVGWFFAEKPTSSVSLSVGWQLLMGSQFEIISDPTGVDGVSDEDFEGEKAKKASDMRKISEGQYPHLEISYVKWLGKRKK